MNQVEELVSSNPPGNPAALAAASAASCSLLAATISVVTSASHVAVFGSAEWTSSAILG